MITMATGNCHEEFIGKKLIPFTTVIGLLAGLTMFVAGVVVMNKQIIPAEISTSVGIQTAPKIVLAAGILSLLVAGLGVFFTCKDLTVENGTGKPLIITLIVCLAVSALLALIGGGVGVDNFKKVEKTFEPDLDKKIEMYGRFGGTMKDVDDLQKKYKCCGVYTYADWRITVWGGHRYDKVPDACCKSETYGCGYIFRDADKTLNKKGCASIVVGNVRALLATVGVIGIIVGIVEVFLCVAFLYCYFCKRGGENYAQQQSPTQSHLGEHELIGGKGGSGSGQSKVGPTAVREEDDPPVEQGESTSNPGVSSKEESVEPSKEKVTYC